MAKLLLKKCKFGKILQVSSPLTQKKLLTTSNITNSPLNTKDAACMFCTLSSQSQRWIIVLFQHMIQNYSNMMRAGGGGGQTSGTPPSQPPSSSQEASNWKGPSWCWPVLAASNSEYSWMVLCPLPLIAESSYPPLMNIICYAILQMIIIFL